MVKVKGQLMSLGASGSIGKVATFSNWKGHTYARHYAQPTNNQQISQLGLRAVMSFLAQQWSILTAGQQATWEARAELTNISPFNAYQSENLTRGVDNQAPTKELPAVEAVFNPSAAALSVVDMDTYVDVQYSGPPTPVAWNVSIYRDAASGFTPTIANMVHSEPSVVVPTIAHIRDIPPSRGTWYYRYRMSDDAGNGKLHANEPSVTW